MLQQSQWSGTRAGAAQALQSPGWRQQEVCQCCLLCLWGLYAQRTGSQGTGSWTAGTSIWDLVLIETNRPGTIRKRYVLKQDSLFQCSTKKWELFCFE